MRCLLPFLALAAPSFACEPRDFLTLPLPEGGRIEVALELAYPGLDVQNGEVVLQSGARIALPPHFQTDPETLLETPSVTDQFAYTYPLAFSLEARKVPWFDPGRVRNDAFFRALWFGSETEAKASLRRVHHPGGTFLVTEKFCADVQLRAALDEITEIPGTDRFFASAGGSFNWRTIAGTNRLSAHSFGISIDLNPDIGKYWRWSGGRPGAAGPYANEIPRRVVAAFERRGFIWGGKWHHFDGMHFEYRPELILDARMADDRPLH